MNENSPGGHARPLYMRLLSGVAVSRSADEQVTTIANERIRLSLRCTRELGSQLSAATAAPVVGLPDSLVQLLLDHDLAVRGWTPATTSIAAVHAAQNGCYNGGQSYDRDTLLSWQEHARDQRLPSAHELRPRGALFRPGRSFAVNDADEYPATPEDVARVVEAFYHHAEVPYASAGGLYPVHIVGELVGHGTCRAEGPGFRATWHPQRTGQRLIEDPTLAATSARIWFVLDLKHAGRKYGARSYRYGLIETGAAVTYLEHLACSMGLGSRQFGGFDDHEVGRRLLGDADDVLVTHCLALRRTPARDPAPAVAVQVMRVGGYCVHLATAWEGGRRGSGPSQKGASAVPERMLGQAVETDSTVAVAKAVSEMAERVAFVRNPELSATNGMAAHPLRSQARLNACLELYERHCLMSRWFRGVRPSRLALGTDPTSTVLADLAAARRLDLHVGAITDSAWGIPAATVVVRSRISRAVLLGTSSALDMVDAVSSAGQEVLKSLMYRIQRSPRAESLFEPRRGAAHELRTAADHESWFGNDEVPRAETEVLVPEESPVGTTRTDAVALDRLLATTSVAETSDSPWRYGRYVAVASHPNLVPVRFGQCTDDYRAAVVERLGIDPLFRWPHPLG